MLDAKQLGWYRDVYIEMLYGQIGIEGRKL